MKYAIYSTSNDGFEDSFICNGATKRDVWIKEMIKTGDYIKIKWCKIYKSGEYGRRIEVM